MLDEIWLYVALVCMSHTRVPGLSYAFPNRVPRDWVVRLHADGGGSDLVDVIFIQCCKNSILVIETGIYLVAIPLVCA